MTNGPRVVSKRTRNTSGAGSAERVVSSKADCSAAGPLAHEESVASNGPTIPTTTQCNVRRREQKPRAARFLLLIQATFSRHTSRNYGRDEPWADRQGQRSQGKPP